MEHIQITAQAVAEAIAIERERCAQIADRQALNLRTEIAIFACEKIAIDIRSGKLAHAQTARHD